MSSDKWIKMTPKVLILAVYACHILTQWIERPPGVREVMGFIPVGDSDLFFVPRSSHVDQITFHISLPSLKYTIFIHLSTHFFFYSLCAMLVTCWKKLAFLMRTSLSKIILTLDYGMSVNHLVKRSYNSSLPFIHVPWHIPLGYRKTAESTGRTNSHFFF